MILTPAPPDRPILLAFDLIRRYAEQRGWIPIGWRSFSVGPWTVTVNGTADPIAGVLPYHALIEHRDIVAMLLISPYAGSGGGRQDTEALFIHDMEAALADAGTDEGSE